MAQNPWATMNGGGSNGWRGGPAPLGPGGPIPRVGPPGRDGGSLWNPHVQQLLTPPWMASPPHIIPQQGPWAQPGGNKMPPPHAQHIAPMPPQQQWGAHKVDQGTPWEPKGQPEGLPQPFAWRPQLSVQGVPQPWAPPDWQPGQAAPSHEGNAAVAPGQWALQGQPSGPAPLMGLQAPQWGQPPPMGAHLPPHVIEQPNQQDRGMENPSKLGTWLTIYPSDVNNDMMWHDPNPKQKRSLRDNGTHCWGDPDLQAPEIRRWKDHADDDTKATGSDYNSGWGDLPGDRWAQGWNEDADNEFGPYRSSVSAEHHLTQMPDMRSGSIPVNAGSRLQQWRKSAAEDKSLEASMQNMTLNPSIAEWSAGGEAWNPGELAAEIIKEDDANVTGPREFVPGKKWEWRDPNKVAEDPNATPGLFNNPGSIFTSTWAPGAENADSNAWKNGEWVVVQLAPNVGEKTVRATAEQVGTLSSAYVAGQIAYVKFSDLSAAQAVQKMHALLPFAVIYSLSDSEVPNSVMVLSSSADNWSPEN